MRMSDIEISNISFLLHIDKMSEIILIPRDIFSESSFNKLLESKEESYGLFMSTFQGLIYLGSLDELIVNEFINDKKNKPSFLTNDIHIYKIQDNQIEKTNIFLNIERVNNYLRDTYKEGQINKLLETFNVEYFYHLSK